VAAKYVFRAPTPEDIAFLAANMRHADIAEIQAAGDTRNLFDVVRDGVADSALCVAVESCGELLCIGGAAGRSLMSSKGVAWMLCTKAIEKHNRLFLLHGRDCVRVLLLRYAMLENYIDARNIKSIRWLKKMGFAIQEPMPHPISGRMFCRFSISRK